MKPTFPIEVSRGGVVVRIFRQKAAGVFTVAYYENGQRKRVSFGDLAKAREEAAKIADRLSRHAGGSLVLQGSDLVEYARAQECLHPLGVRLDIAASEYSQAMSLLNGKGTLLEAIRYFSASNAHSITPIRTDKLVADLLKAREANHASHRHIRDLRSRLGRFAKAFRCDVHTIRAAQVQDFLLSLQLSPRSIINFRMAISNLFSHAKLRGHAPKDFDPLEGIPLAKESDSEVEIFAPDELKIMLDHVRRELVPYLTIAAFAGLRQAEVGRLDWSEVKDDHILIMGGVSKNKVKRHAPLPLNLSEWLRPFRKESGPVVPFDNITLQLGKLAEDANLDWKRNGLRHAFGSHRLAIEKNPDSVAYEMGNSRAMVFKHYRRVVAESQAARWFALYPDVNLKPVFRLPAKPDVLAVPAAA